MLKRLRWKFTLLLTLLLSGVLAAVLVVQTGSNLQQYRAGTDAVLAAALRRSQAAGGKADWLRALPEDVFGKQLFCSGESKAPHLADGRSHRRIRDAAAYPAGI